MQNQHRVTTLLELIEIAICTGFIRGMRWSTLTKPIPVSIVMQMEFYEGAGRLDKKGLLVALAATLVFSMPGCLKQRN